MKKIILILVILASSQVKAQFIKEKTLDVSIGLGYSFPDEDIDIAGSGFYFQGEYVLVITNWIDVRPYAGIILTRFDGKDFDGNPTIYKSTSNAFLMGAKTRLRAPIPWVAPFIEMGVGLSIGSFETFTPYTDIDKSGLIPHIPITLGLELGRKHNFDIGILYYLHPSAEQFTGALAFGFSIPLN